MRRKTKRCLLPWSYRTLLLILVMVVVTLVFGQTVLSWYDSSKQERRKQKQTDILRGYTQILQEEPSKPLSCPIPKFHNISQDDKRVQCHRMEPSSASCKKAKELYENKQTKQCGLHKEICKLKFNHTRVAVRCNPELCGEGDVLLGLFDLKNGQLDWNRFPSLKDLGKKFQELLSKRDPSIESGMAFVHCGVKNITRKLPVDREEEVGSDYVAYNEESGFIPEMYGSDYNGFDERSRQLLIFPKISKHLPSSKTKHSDLNINVLFLDSVSHSHFFRSLPMTVKQLQKLDKDPNLHVFNFDLMQSLKGRTFENQQVLFSGSFEGGDNLLKTAPMFSALKKKHYTIIWNEDLCWKWEWGLSRNFGFDEEKGDLHKRWNAFQEALRQNVIDEIGASLAACEIMKFNDKNDPFHGLDKVCYNGKYHHSYIFEFLKQIQTHYSQAGKPYFQFTELNVGHDEDGLRIKTLDADLSAYIEYLSSLNNTLTIMFSDHGNTYTKFASQTEEGHLEMFHPMMFIIAPRDFSKLVKASGVHSLRLNQHRLVSLLDVHYMLMFLTLGTTEAADKGPSDVDIEPRGLLDVISPARTCLSLPLFPNTKCICKAAAMNSTYSSSHLLLADFALGTLNNMIQSQYHGAHPRSNVTFGSCRKLEGTVINDVTERLGRHNTTQVELKVFTKPGLSFQDEDEVFYFSISIEWHIGSTFNVTGYERMSRFSKYEKCADQEVEGRLCICDTIANKSLQQGQNVSNSKYPRVFNKISKRQRIHHCLTVFERRRRAGVILDGLNECVDTNIEIEIQCDMKNMITSTKLPAKFVIHGSQNLFLVGFLGIGKSDHWVLNYSVNVTSSWQ
ncbi:hypothetical protein HOLleu_29851 [Holothuria leucospilota]|uniref:Uncharacterized protein n=1 Tax=Holothuria leucospilota TaxID=206669 RepID=A0A9Q1BJT8_HOLLE|nr:hypothetical protein HOLleu_29851 [Holothuria leucospilota]